MIKKLSVLSLLALSTTSAVAAEALDSRFTFLSGGVAFDSNGFAKEAKKSDQFKFLKDKGFIEKQPKNSIVGGYLTGAYSLNNGVFFEGRLRYMPERKNGYFAGVGYHYPLDPKTDVYALGGISQFDTPAAIKITQDGKNKIQADFDAFRPRIDLPTEFFDKDMLLLKSQPAFGLEFGVRSMLTEELGVQAFYRATRETSKLNVRKTKITPTERAYLMYDGKVNYFSHELSLGAYYHFTPQLAAEISYSYQKHANIKFKPLFITNMDSDMTVIKLGANHRGTVGLRYAF